MNVYGDDLSLSRKPHWIRTTIRKFKRFHRGGSPRQQVVILLGWFLLAYAVTRYTHFWTDSSSTAGLICDTPKHERSHAIPLPNPSDKEKLSQIWKTLQTVFDAYPPQPLNLTLKTFKSISEFPSLEDIKNHTKISKKEARAARTAHVEVTKRLPSYPERTFSGHGIVMLAGGRYSGFATTGLGMLREVGSKLPIEVWVKDKSEEREGWCTELAKEGTVCRRLSDYMDLLFLDADNVPIKNPDFAFQSKAFTGSGVVLWPDYWKHTGSPMLPYVVGLSNGASEMLRNDQTAESGQLMWDKKRHWKDTFTVALRSLRQNYSMVPHPLKTLFVNGTSHGIGMLQADPANQIKYEPMFLHSNIIKWSIHEFMCVNCSSSSSDPVALSAIENPESAINPHLKDHHRIFKTEDMQSMAIDPEPNKSVIRVFGMDPSMFGVSQKLGLFRA
ncbi:MAG: hypothetical protein Q9167_000202 [Letrouitia subvulpina]